MDPKKKFKVLLNNQAYMARLGIYSYNLTKPTNEEFFKHFMSYYILAAATICCISSFEFILENMTEVKQSLNAFKIIISALQFGGMFLYVGLNLDKVKAFHLNLQDIIDKDNNEEVIAMYWKTEAKARKFSKWCGYYVLFHTSAFTIVLIYALSCILRGRYDTSTWYLSFDIILPFDKTKVIGWFCTWGVQFSMAFSYSLGITAVTGYFVCCCNYVRTMCDHFQWIIHKIQSDIELNMLEKHPQKAQINRINIAKLVNSAVILHNKIYENFYLLAEINSGGVFWLLPANAIFMSVSMYDIEESASNFEPKVLLFDMSCLLCALFWPALICSFGTFATDRILLVADNAYDSNWYEYPVEVRKNLILILVRSQEPVYFMGHGVIRATLEVFGKLFRTSCSYYLMFRTFARINK